MFEYNIEDQIKKIDAGVAFDLSKQLKKGREVTINLRYNLGLSYIIKDNAGEAQKSSSLLLSAHVMIGRGDRDKEVSDQE